MAEKEMADYFSGTLVADYTAVELSTPAQLSMIEMGEKLQEIRKGDDGSEERVSFSDDTEFYVKIKWAGLEPATAGLIIDMYHDSTKANGIENSFYWYHPTDGYTYVVRFDSGVPRTIGPSWVHSFGNVTLRVLGVKA